MLDQGDCCPMRFGTGLSAAYPPVWENQITIQSECDDRFEVGMAFYIHASVQSMNDHTSTQPGGSFLMKPDGPERLDKAPLEQSSLTREQWGHLLFLYEEDRPYTKILKTL
ncbi:MAG: hypothetical protein R3268_00525 [Acidiferrobacterales bacterium]|nr:hypothetical protein [Acidiferrobacterales bacterium]